MGRLLAVSLLGVLRPRPWGGVTLRAALPLAFLAAASGCVHTTTETRTAHVQVETVPEGARVALVEGGQERNLGPAPLTAELPYSVDHRVFDGACWALPGTALGLTIGGVALGVATGGGDSVTGPVIGYTVAGLAAVGLIYGTLYCAIAAGTAQDRVYPRSHDLRVRMPGHETQTVRTEVPRSDHERIVLVPEAAP